MNILTENPAPWTAGSEAITDADGNDVISHSDLNMDHWAVPFMVSCVNAALSSMTARAEAAEGRLHMLQLNYGKLQDDLAAARAALQMVRDRWTFADQYHTHTWHDWADCKVLIDAVLPPVPAKAGEEKPR